MSEHSRDRTNNRAQYQPSSATIMTQDNHNYNSNCTATNDETLLDTTTTRLRSSFHATHDEDPRSMIDENTDSNYKEMMLLKESGGSSSTSTFDYSVTKDSAFTLTSLGNVFKSASSSLWSLPWDNVLKTTVCGVEEAPDRTSNRHDHKEIAASPVKVPFQHQHGNKETESYHHPTEFDASVPFFTPPIDTNENTEDGSTDLVETIEMSYEPRHNITSPYDVDHVYNEQRDNDSRSTNSEGVTHDVAYDRHAVEHRLRNAVCFGWIKHAPTNVWRQIVKRFSDDRVRYPKWNDDICRQVLSILHKEANIHSFYQCAPANKDNPMKRKLFDRENNKCCGNWQLVTDNNVIMEKTKQRFADDRKKNRRPKSPVSSNENRRDTSPTSDQSPSSSTATYQIHASLPPSPSLAVDCHNTLSQTPPPYMPGLLLCSRCSRSTEDSESSLLSVHNNTVVSRAPAHIDWHGMTHQSPVECQYDEPCYTMSPETTVCLDSEHHPGTKKWREAIQLYSSNWVEYPEWHNGMYYSVTKKLAEEGYCVFLDFRDAHGDRCYSVCDGLWFRSPERTVFERTKQQFYADRHQPIY